MLFSCKHALIINRQWHNSLSSNMLSPLYLHSIKLCVCDLRICMCDTEGVNISRITVTFRYRIYAQLRGDEFVLLAQGTQNEKSSKHNNLESKWLYYSSQHDRNHHLRSVSLSEFYWFLSTVMVEAWHKAFRDYISLFYKKRENSLSPWPYRAITVNSKQLNSF